MIEYKAEGEDVFVITYDRFDRLGEFDLEELTVDYHLRNIIEIALIGFLIEYYERRMQAPAFTKMEREQIDLLCQHYLSRIGRFEALEALNSLKPLSAKAKQFLRDWSHPISTIFSAALAAKGIPHTSVNLSPGSAADMSLAGPLKAHLEVVQDLILSIGFKSMYVLIDKVDETAETGNNAEASFNLVKPLLRDLELLQIKKIGFKFFLWDKLADKYKAYARPDRLEQFDLVWTEADLDKMLSKRLAAFSDDKVNDLSELTIAQLAKPLHTLVVLFAEGSPRDMIRLCQEILAEQLQIDPDSTLIDVVAVIQGISKFSIRRAQEILPQQIYRELVKAGRLDFTATHIAHEVFKFELNSARTKIRQWTEAGAVAKVGEVDTGGHPIYQYAILDIRVAKAIMSQLELTDFLGDKIHFSPKCKTLLIRDWDLGHPQTCHACGLEWQARTPPPESTPTAP